MARNVFINPSAANDLTRWAVGGTSPTRVTNLTATPKASGLTVATSSSAFNGFFAVGGANTSTAGVAWTLSGWVFSSVARTLRCYMSVYNNDSFVATQSTGRVDLAITANTWTEVVLQQTTPTGTYNNLRFHVDTPTGVASTIGISSVRADNVTENPFPYRDGDYPGWAWGGTAGSSISEGTDVVLEPGRFLLAY